MQLNLKRYKLFFLIATAYLLSLFFRFWLAYETAKHPEFMFNGKIIALWTPDAGLYGHYAKMLLQGAPLSFSNETALGYVIYWIVKFFGFDLDVVIYYLPAYLASMIVVPIILIFWLFRLEWVGFFSAVISSIAMNYYFRTHLGYCDTDIVVFPLYFLLIFSLIAILNRGIYYSIYGVIATEGLLLFYHSAKPIVYGTLLLFVAIVFILKRKEIRTIYGVLVLIIAALPFAWYITLPASLVSLVGFHFLAKKISLNYKVVLTFFLLMTLGVGGYAYKQGYFQRAFDYLQKKSSYVLKEKGQKSIEFEATLKTVAESRSITLSQLFTYSAGNIVIFLSGTLGLLLFLVKFPNAMPLLIPYFIGLLSLKAGVRFTTFAVPVLMMGNIFLFYFFWQKLERRRFAVALFFLPSFALLLFYINIMQKYNMMVEPFFKKGELQAIDTVLNRPQKGYILTWWDYGWPLWYYTNKRTIIDNGKHHWDNFIIARTLFSLDERFIANFDRYFIEQYDRIYPWSILPYVLKRQSLTELLFQLRTSSLGVKKRNEIYYYFDDKILTKLPVIEKFAYTKSEAKDKKFVWIDKVKVISTKRGVVVTKAAKINLRKGTIEVGGRKDKIGKLIFHDGERIIGVFTYRRDPYTIIVYKNKYVLGTVGYANSFFFKAFFFNSLDPELFKTESFTKEAKIFRLRD